MIEDATKNLISDSDFIETSFAEYKQRTEDKIKWLEEENIILNKKVANLAGENDVEMFDSIWREEPPPSPD